ncbi:Acyltransferase family protein [Tritrichomonas foetus]|uniref:Acyltransferase family protein n=1 Tax=Tritrichomonas foetus TaxID=1144522 RepID=A0A1J4J1S2_9EUKA|nr:Acyltransferase family protein [Tritrichomonas foetus]|eukprot:OHS93464.1 Acyltransferase family protein [Tritrichomonas foetus]
MLSCIPFENSSLKEQTELSKISDEEMAQVKSGPFFTWYQRLFQVLTFVVFLGPIRAVIGIGCFLIMGTIVVIINSILKALKCDLDKWRHFTYNIGRIGVRILMWSLGVGWIHVDGEFDEDARFIIANHIGLLDPLIIVQIKYVSCVLKKEFSSLPFIRDIISVTDPIYVDRSKPCGLTKHIIQQASNMKKDPIMIFPEGAICNGNYMLKFHKSAFLTNYKVQPVVVQFWTPFSPSKWNTFSWLDQGPLELLWNYYSIPFSICRVKVLPAIQIDSENGDIEALATKAQLMMANELGIKAIDRSSNEFYRTN